MATPSAIDGQSGTLQGNAVQVEKLAATFAFDGEPPQRESVSITDTERTQLLKQGLNDRGADLIKLLK